MRRFIFFTILCFALSAMILPVMATEITLDQSQSQLELEIVNQLTAGRQMVDVEMLPLTDGSGSVLYGAAFKPMSGTIHHVLGAETTAWTNFINMVDGLSGRWMDFEIELIDGVITRSGIFWEGGGEDYTTQISTTNDDDDFQTQLGNAQDASLTIIDFEAFKDHTGLVRYGGIWVDGSIQPRTQLLYGLTWNEVADLLDPLPGRVVDVERYFDDQSRQRYGVILAMYPNGGSQVVRDLPEQALVDFDAGKSDNLIDLDSYETAPGIVFYSGVWGDDWKSMREVAPMVSSTAIDPGTDLQDIFTAFEANGAGEMGLFGRNVRIGKSVEYRADEPFYLASSAKLAMHIRLWQLHQSGHLDINNDTLWYSTDPNTAIPWFVDERPDCGGSIGECGLTTGACGDGDDRNQAIPLLTLDRGMMWQSDNAATSMIVDDTTLGLAFDDIDLNEWVSSLSGVARGFGVLSSIQDLDRVIAWQGQFPNTNNDPSYFGAPRAGLETVLRGGGLGYRECQLNSDGSWPVPGIPCGCTINGTPRTVCVTGQTCTRRPDPWGDLTNYLVSVDPSWPTDTFPARNTTIGNSRYYNTGLNFATPRAFGELQEKLISVELLDGPTTELALNVMLQGGQTLQQSVPGHIEAFSKGGAKGGASRPCSDTTIFRVGPDAVVVNAMSEDNNVNAAPNQRTCGQVSAFWSAPPTTSGTPLGLAVVRQLLSDLRTADPQIVGFSPTTIHHGQTFEAVVDVTNSGGVETSAFDVTFYATLNTSVGSLDAGDFPIGSFRVTTIAAGETARIQFSGTFPASIPEDAYRVGWYIDPPDDQQYGEVGEFTEGTEQHGVILSSVLTVLPPAPPCVDVDLDGYIECTPDCDPTGLTCGDCNDDDNLINPIATDVCNQLDDDCDGTPDPGALMPGTIRKFSDPDHDTNEKFGEAIAGIGDVDGDGIDDFAIGQPGADSSVANNAGLVHLYSGASGDMYCTVHDNVGSTSDRFGASVAGIGDVTGDGIPDFLVGAPGYDGLTSNEGSAIVFSGATCSRRFRVQWVDNEANAEFGSAVAGVGDVNLDGTPDIAVGAPLREGAGTNRGRVYVFAGGNGARLWELFDPNGQDNDRIGSAITVPGDLDGDLVPDIVTAATNRNSGRGVVLPFNGGNGSLIGTWSILDASSGDKLGFSLASLGDVTGDGVPDIVAGEIDGDTTEGSNAGDAMIFSGATGAWWRTLKDPGGATNDEFGYSVANAGDMDGDGLDDVVVGTRFTDTPGGSQAGAALVFSSATGAVLFDLEDPEGEANDQFGFVVASVGDQTGDGFSEFAVGAPLAQELDAANAGRVFVYSMEADCDADGISPFNGDCDDQDSTIGPGMTEICDSVDNDCDLLIDEDDDGDGVDVCTDCDDADALIYPGATERCNSLDDDCDLDIDEGVDADMDGFDDICDCDDGNNAINPGQSDLTCDRIDQDCNGVTDDGFATPPGVRTSDLGVEGDSSDQLGTDVTVVGDLNGDGLAEYAAGVPGDDTQAGSAGAVAVFDGATGDLHCMLIHSFGVANDNLGGAVAAAGDVTGDGIPDILAGATGDNSPIANAGSVRVFSGADCTEFDNVFDSNGESADKLGDEVASIGDQNGDGKPEFAAAAIGANQDGMNDTGRVVVFDGATGSLLYRVTNINPRAGDQFGSSIAGGRDLDADGIPDFVVGAALDDTKTGVNAGSVMVFSGATGEPIRKLIYADGGISDRLGMSVALIDDLNGDAVADILAGMPEDDDGGNNAGAVVVFSGADGSLIGKASFDHAGSTEQMGMSVEAMSDINGDGVADFAAGAPFDDIGGTDNGSVILISGADLSLIQTLSRDAGEDASRLGTSVAVSPDLTGDGMPDIVAGVPLQNSPEGTSNFGLVVLFAQEADCDGDGVSPFGGDCDDADGSASGQPGAVEAFTFTDKENASWQPPADPGGTTAGLSYDVIRAGDPTDFDLVGVCVETDDTDTTVFLPDVPVLGDVHYFLVRAENVCDIGPAGQGSDLQERAVRSCP